VRRTSFALTALAALGGCGGGDDSPPEGNAVTVEVPRSPADQPGVTPMAERVAVLGLLNKRNGIVRDLTLRPGQAIRVKDVVVRLRACETTAPWESEKLTGAFVQLDVQRTDSLWARVFSGWLYKESPSLNVVEHPVYDVWPKSCAMSFPAGPDVPAGATSSSRRSSAPKSGGGNESVASPVPAEPSPAPEPSAADSNST
jgi:hypothetical protein